MPRLSGRQRNINAIELVLKKRIFLRSLRRILHVENNVDDAIDLGCILAYAQQTDNRYSHRFKYRKIRQAVQLQLLKDLSATVEDDECQPWLNDSDFLKKYRLTRESFSAVVDLLKNNPVFQNDRKHGIKQAPVEFQFMVFMKFIGTEGSGACNESQRQLFGIGSGTSLLYRDRVAQALSSLRETVIKWPDADERKQISLRIHKEFNIPHCVAIADGTLFPLAFEPQTEDAPDYSGRKYGFSLSTMILCDDKRRIRYYLAGWPGSAHDNRIYKSTKIAKNPTEYFSKTQFVLGDSAFENSQYMVSAFKKPNNLTILRKHEKFNEHMAKLRIVSEHTIGMLKGRFPWLRSIRMPINEKDKKKCLKRILLYIDATIVLHNLLLERDDQCPDEWIDDDDVSDFEDADEEMAPYREGDELNQGIPTGAPKDRRRSQVLAWLLQKTIL